MSNLGKYGQAAGSKKGNVASRRDIYERLHSRSLHTIGEMRDILAELQGVIRECAKKDFDKMFALEKELAEAGFQQNKPVDLKLPSTTNEKFFNPYPYQKLPIQDYRVMDNVEFTSGPFLDTVDISARVQQDIQKKVIQLSDDKQKEEEKEKQKEDEKLNEEEQVKEAEPESILTQAEKSLSPGALAFLAKLVKLDEKDGPLGSTTSLGATSSSSTQQLTVNQSITQREKERQREKESKFKSPVALKESIRNMHFLIATIMQRDDAARKDRATVIEHMTENLKELKGLHEKEIEDLNRQKLEEEERKRKEKEEQQLKRQRVKEAQEN
ncbi:MAG: hypothetical protein EZS28_012849 [Streblomastix strix]|uniref:Uncharacterized protein n=1 Tax=Streblomastix strix TaxID=222440 RepID=A0A5J4W9M6_9EUKA|nr:MAG: hypothetical protein EZS28_012849 [Streblomastix strix]